MNKRMNYKEPEVGGCLAVMPGRDDGGMAQSSGMKVMRNGWIVTVFGRWQQQDCPTDDVDAKNERPEA